MNFPGYGFLELQQYRFGTSSPVSHSSDIKWEPDPGAAQYTYKALSLKEYANYLNAADILDNSAINLAGAAVWMPYGLKLRKIFDQFISDVFEAYGLSQFNYPSLLPADMYDPLAGLYDLTNKMLCTGTEEEINNRKYRAVLSPSGEAPIYTHWSKYIKGRKLPLKMFSNSVYFRPVGHQAGMGIFNSAEASGVFEFHAAYEDRSHIDKEIVSYQLMLEEVFTFFRIHRIWSLRPRWTNNAAVSLYTFGADTILPNNTSLQIGAIYDQDSIFSERYNIYTSKDGTKNFTKQISGFCSKRLLLCQLMIAGSVMGRFFIHPHFSPLQTAIIFQKKTMPAGDIDQTIEKIKSALHLRHTFDVCDTPDGAGKLYNHYRSKGVPLIVRIQDRRDRQDRYKIILYRNDNGAGYGMLTDDIMPVLPGLISVAISDIIAYSDEKTDNYFHSKFTGDIITTEAEMHSSSQMVKTFPLSFTEANVRYIEQTNKGEIIGFVRTGSNYKCILTSGNVNTLGILCRRF